MSLAIRYCFNFVIIMYLEGRYFETKLITLFFLKCFLHYFQQSLIIFVQINYPKLIVKQCFSNSIIISEFILWVSTIKKRFCFSAIKLFISIWNYTILISNMPLASGSPLNLISVVFYLSPLFFHRFHYLLTKCSTLIFYFPFPALELVFPPVSLSFFQ